MTALLEFAVRLGSLRLGLISTSEYGRLSWAR